VLIALPSRVFVIHFFKIWFVLLTLCSTLGLSSHTSFQLMSSYLGVRSCPHAIHCTYSFLTSFKYLVSWWGCKTDCWSSALDLLTVNCAVWKSLVYSMCRQPNACKPLQLYVYDQYTDGIL
jgi:hypothetical protein